MIEWVFEDSVTVLAGGNVLQSWAVFSRSLQCPEALNLWLCLFHSQNKWIKESRVEVVATVATVTTSDPLTKFLLPFLMTLRSSDLEAPVPPRMFQSEDTEQQ